MTWNIEALKPHQYVLTEILLSQLPDLVFISEPQTFQTDISQLMKTVAHEYCYWLNSDDLYEPDLHLVKSKAHGGTMVMWRRSLDPHIQIHPVLTSAFLPIILQPPSTRPSVHIAIYLPTSGKEYEFITELASLKNCLDEINEKYSQPAIFIRGDGNCNPKNVSRFNIFSNFIRDYNLCRVDISHPTYHHFVGEGRYDSNIDLIMYTRQEYVTETITQVMCKLYHPEFITHHDLILSRFSLPTETNPVTCTDLVTAPRVTIPRHKILWNEEGVACYKELVSEQLEQVRSSWLEPTSRALTSVLLQSTNQILNIAAMTTNPSVLLSNKKQVKTSRIPAIIKAAKRKLQSRYKTAKTNQDCTAWNKYGQAKQAYRQAVKTIRLQQAIERDKRLDTILTKNPRKLYSYLRSCKQTQTSNIEKLTVRDKQYQGSTVGDGFYDSMTSLKSCNMEDLMQNPDLMEHFTNYENILKICSSGCHIPLISTEAATKVLKRLKSHVIDIYSITAKHYSNAGDKGIEHFKALLNCVISDVNNAT